MKYTPNKWQVQCRLYKRPEFLDDRRTFILGLYKLTSLPMEGTYPAKRNYKGFIFVVTFMIKKGY